MDSYLVEGVTWKLAGSVYQQLYPLGLFSYKHAQAAMSLVGNLFGQNNEDILPPPQRIIHTGIVVYGYLYEYGDKGVKKTEAIRKPDPGSMCKVDGFLNRKRLGKSSKPIQVFDIWIKQQMEGRFAAKNYCVSKNNCNHFAIAAAQFLKVSPPEEWSKVCEFTERSSNTVKLANVFNNSSTSTHTS